MTDITDNIRQELSLSVSTDINDQSWPEIVGQLTDQLVDGDLPDKVIQATEMLLAGMPQHKIAKKLGVTTHTIRGWVNKYPVMAAVISNGKKLLTRWRLSKLEQQFLTALERSQEILEIPLNGVSNGDVVNPKVLTVVAAQARYIIGIFAGQQQNITVTHEAGQTLLNAQQDALDYLASKLQDQQELAAIEPIDAVFRVVDDKFDSGPLLDEAGEPPFGKLGELTETDDGLVCSICGKPYKNLSRHLLRSHNTSTGDYETLYMLEEGAIRKKEKDLGQV